MGTTYALGDHGVMLADEARLDQYLAAIASTVQPGDVVVDIGCGIGIFAIAACRAGAARVYAIEADDVIEVAEALAAENGCGDRITFMRDWSHRVTLPEPARVAVFDVRGILPNEQVAVAHDARRFLGPGGVCVPQRDTVWAAPVCLPVEHASHVSGGPLGVDLAPWREVAAGRYYKCRLAAPSLAAEPQRVATFDYPGRDDGDLCVELEWEINEPCTLHGLAQWFTSEVCEGVVLSNGPDRSSGSLYGQAFFPWPEPVTVRAGDRLHARLEGMSGVPYRWRWRTTIRREGNKNAVASFDQPSANLAPTSHRVDVARGREVDALALRLMTGDCTVQEIAARVCRRYPGRFPAPADAQAHVAALASLYAHSRSSE